MLFRSRSVDGPLDGLRISPPQAFSRQNQLKKSALARPTCANSGRQLGLLLGIGLAVYGRSLKFDFILDDHRFTGDSRIQESGHIFRVLLELRVIHRASEVWLIVSLAAYFAALLANSNGRNCGPAWGCLRRVRRTDTHVAYARNISGVSVGPSKCPTRRFSRPSREPFSRRCNWSFS